MKCLHCGKEMINTVGGCYHCPTCGFGVDDCVLRTVNPAGDIPTPQSFGKQEGWVCPVCGRGVAPWVNYCPCQGSELKITYGTGLDNVYKICTPDTDTMKFIDKQHNKLYETLGIPKDLLEG